MQREWQGHILSWLQSMLNSFDCEKVLFEELLCHKSGDFNGSHDDGVLVAVASSGHD